jgi:hypothetical protein
MKLLAVISLLVVLVSTSAACQRSSSPGFFHYETDAGTDAGTDTGSDSDVSTDPLDCAGGRYDASTGLCWQHPRASEWYSWQEAIDYCDGLHLAGHSDWYLPSLDDFIDLLGDCDSDVMNGDVGYCESCDDSTSCTELFGSDNTGWFWSSSSFDSSHAWTVRFDNGSVDHLIQGYQFEVRCVREGT